MEKREIRKEVEQLMSINSACLLACKGQRNAAAMLTRIICRVTEHEELHAFGEIVQETEVGRNWSAWNFLIENGWIKFGEKDPGAHSDSWDLGDIEGAVAHYSKPRYDLYRLVKLPPPLYQSVKIREAFEESLISAMEEAVEREVEQE